MALDLARYIKPDSYVPCIYDINYPKLYENGIRCAVFDVDCTLLPFDDVKVTDDNELLFRYLNNIGIETGLCSSGSEKRVKSVADVLDTKYLSRAAKPFVPFCDIKTLFSDVCAPYNTIMIGDSIFLDMFLAGRNDMPKILVDMIRDKVNLTVRINDVIQGAMYVGLKKEGFKKKKYYRGMIER